MKTLIRKIHTYTGLLSFSVLTVFGIVGLASNLLPPHHERPRPEPQITLRDYTAPGGLTDKQLADELHRSVDLPLTNPAPEWQIRRDENNDLVVNFYTPTGFRRVTVLERESKLRIERESFDLWQFLFNMHEVTPNWAAPGWPLRVWAWYVEFSIAALGFMALSGVYLWLASRPRHRGGRIAFALGAGLFALLWLASRWPGDV